MAQTVVLLGISYSVPETTDANFDVQLTAYLKALASAFPQLNGGVQSLTAELDFGASFGVKAAWFKSETANPASAGQVRLAKTDSIKIRNNANGADLALAIDTGDNLTFAGANVTGNPLAGANTNAGQSIPNNANTAVVFGTVELDTDSGYNSGTGVYTVPAAKGGHYEVTAEIAFNIAITGTVAVGIRKGGVIQKEAQFINTGAKQTLIVSALLNLAAGNTIDVYAFQNSGGAVVLENQAVHNFIALKRIPT